MTHEELFSLADKVGLGFIRHASAREIEKFEGLVKLVAQRDRANILAVIGDNQCECRCAEVVRDGGLR
jgi:hypothetical protein